MLFLPQFWLFPIYRELLNTASRNRPSKNSEVRRAASGLVKVLCMAQASSAGQKGSRKGKPLKQGGALTKFNDWFGSMSLMNTLYVWFPASWGPSVVEAISKRNQRWLQQNPVHRDPAMFNSQEVHNAIASRDMRYKIQKWNVNSDKVHPILVANARVDWLYLDDTDITQQFEILCSSRRYVPSLLCHRRACFSLASMSACCAVRFSMLNPSMAASTSIPRKVLVV